MSSYLILLALLPMGIWLRLVLAQGGFWRERPVTQRALISADHVWPRIVAVVPARNEADIIEQSIGSLLGQQYPGSFEIILVDDQSNDGTAERARLIAGQPSEKLTILAGAPLPDGWVGKMWALAQGVDAAMARAQVPTYIWFTDADIGHDYDNLMDLAARAERDHLDLVSQMVRLDTSTWAEKFLIPAFVYFFAMLYPFAWVNDRSNKMAAAAGGSMLVRATALAQSGGIAGIRREIIDDCALARQIKALPAPMGGLHLSLTDKARSLRSYGGFAGIARMVARSAYTQLNYSPLALTGTLLGLMLTFVLPLTLIFIGGPQALLALLTYGLMVLSFGPILEVYRLSPLYALSLPLVAVIYAGFTLRSAIEHMRGRGAQWKGRIGAGARPVRNENSNQEDEPS